MNIVFLFALVSLPVACRAAPTVPVTQQVPVAQQVAVSQGNDHDGYSQLTVDGDYGALLLVGHGDRFTAILDGDVLPAERVVREGDKLTVRGPGGESFYEIRVLEDGHGLMYPYKMVAGMRNASIWQDGVSRGGLDANAIATTWPSVTAWSTGNRKLIGVTTSPVDGALRAQLGLGSEGFVVETVTPDMPAARAGMQPFDIVIAVDGGPATTETLRAALDAREPGQKLELTILRQGDEADLELTVEAPRAPSSATMAQAGNAWLYAGGGDQYKALEERMLAENAGAELAEKLMVIQAETEALSQAQTGEAKKQLAELAARQAEITKALQELDARNRASRTTYGLLQGGESGSRVFMLPQAQAVEAERDAAQVAAKASADRIAQLEERLVKLEALLERLAPPADASKSGGDSGKKP